MKYNSYRKSEGQVKGFIPHLFQFSGKGEGFISNLFSVSKRREEGFIPHLFSAFKKGEGFSTIEMLVAFAILSLAFTGILTVVFGNDNFAIDSQLNSEAMFYAERDLNEGRKQAENDFLGFSGFSGTADNGRDETEVEVEGITQCKNLLTSITSWNPTALRAQHVTLQTVVSSLEEFLRLDEDCADEPSGDDDWKYPSSLSSQDFNPGGIPATNVDFSDGYVYVTTNSSPDARHDLWIVNVSDPDPLSLYVVGSADIGAGLFAVDVAGDYAYAANNATSGQLMIINISDKANPMIVATSTLNGVNPEGSYPQARVIFYYNNHVYVGTRETAGPEFHIFSVDPADGASPENPIQVGSRELNHTVRDIVVRGDYAYIATTGNQNELVMLNVSSPGSITPSFPGVGQPEPWKFDADGNEDGTAVYVVGNKAYLGRVRTTGGRPNFYILDIADPESPISLGSDSTILNPNTEISGIVVAGHLAFFSTTNQTVGFQIWDISDSQNPVSWPDCNENEYNHSEKAVGIDFDGEYVYVANESNDALRIFWSNTDNVCN